MLWNIKYNIYLSICSWLAKQSLWINNKLLCLNITCLNNGVCRPLLLDFECECLGDSYSGRYCEITSNRIHILQIVSKSFAYIAIIVMVTVAIFIVIMDVLKYCFSIDPVDPIRQELPSTKRKKHGKKNKSMFITRFHYVNAPSP